MRRREQSLDDGVAAVEFALVLPLLVVLLFVIVNGGMLYLDQLHLQSAARDGARVESVSPANGCTTAMEALSGNEVGTTQCDVVQDCSLGKAEIRLVTNQEVSIPLVGTRTVNLIASSTFVCFP
jgi:uncharacterized membrane protein